MTLRRLGKSALAGLTVAAALLIAPAGWAATVSHSSVAAFAAGKTNGAAQAVDEWVTSGARGAVAAVPMAGAAILNEDFHYATTAEAQSAGWLLLTPHMDEVTYPAGAAPTSFSMTGDALRLHVTHGHNFVNSGAAGQRSPVLALSNKPLTGDFIVETKLTVVQPRNQNDQRVFGVFVGVADGITDNKATGVRLDADTANIAMGKARKMNPHFSMHRYPDEPKSPSTDATGTFAPLDTQELYIKVVKIGAWYHTYEKGAEDQAWAYMAGYPVPGLAGTTAQPLVAGIYERTFGNASTQADLEKDIDVEYFRVNALGQTTGTYSNVVDAGLPVSWQTLSLAASSRDVVKYQLRTGNVQVNGTLIDGGDFVGPDGTSGTYFHDDVAQVIPNPDAKRYLEYRLAVDALPANLRPLLHALTATYQPQTFLSRFASNAGEYVDDGFGLRVQPGGGDIGAGRNEAFRDDFTTDPLANGWTLVNNNPLATGEVNVTERPGYARLKVGYPQVFGIGNKSGGVMLLHDLAGAAGNFEIEAEINLETQPNRIPLLVLWQDENNYVGFGPSRTSLAPGTFNLGLVSQSIINDANRDPVSSINYGSNALQLRVTMIGGWITYSFRDTSGPSPSWRVFRVFDAGTAFFPVKFGILAESSGDAVRDVAVYDINYLSVSDVAATESSINALVPTGPAGSRPDIIFLRADGVVRGNHRFQVKSATGDFVGPDGTFATYLTQDEPKLPDIPLSSPLEVAVYLNSGAQIQSGIPYVHAVGIQYSAPGLNIARDTNRDDFAAGLVQTNLNLDAPAGYVVPAGQLVEGTPTTEDFNVTGQNLEGWLFSNTRMVGGNPVDGPSDYTFTGTSAKLIIGSDENTWDAGTAPEKPRVVLYNTTPLMGDFDIETRVHLPEGTMIGRHAGIAFIGVRPNQPTPDLNLDMSHVVMFGPYQENDTRGGEVRWLVAESDTNFMSLPWDLGASGETRTTYDIRIRKLGTNYAAFTRGSASEAWKQVATEDNIPLGNGPFYIGLMGKGWAGAPDKLWPVEFEYVKVTPLDTNGTLESRVLDLGPNAVTATPYFQIVGASGREFISFRAADTVAALATAPWVGPDGTSNTSYTNLAGELTFKLPDSMIGKRYFQYKATLGLSTWITDIALFGVPTASIPPTQAEILNVLRIAGGLQDATAADLQRYDVVKDNAITIEDAMALARRRAE